MKRTLMASTALVIALLGASCSAINSEPPPPLALSEGLQTFAVNTLDDTLETAWGLDFLPDGDLLITEREGYLTRFNPRTGESVNISGVPTPHVYGQGGLLDVAVHPNFNGNRYVYLSYSYRDPEKRKYTTRLSRGRLQGKRLKQVEHLFDADPAFTSVTHFGSALLFDNEGYLRMTVGDRRHRDLAQDLSTHLGKTLRLTDDGRPAPGNPFAGVAKLSHEVYSYGHRNPQGITIDRDTGRVWIAEHGPKGGDEVNLLRMGRNYGWPVVTYGEEYSGGKIGEGVQKPGMEPPLHYYVPSIATAAIEYYNGDAFPHWKNSLFVAGLKSLSLSRIQLSGDAKVFEERLLEGQSHRIREVRAGPDGYLYLLTEQGRLLQITPK